MIKLIFYICGQNAPAPNMLILVPDLEYRTASDPEGYNVMAFKQTVNIPHCIFCNLVYFIFIYYEIKAVEFENYRCIGEALLL